MKTKFFSMMILLVCIAFAASAQDKDQKSGGDKVYYVVDEMPQFPGGEEALRTFVASGVTYPPEAVAGKIQGKVIITFVIDKAGKVTDAKVIRSAHPLLDAEALRVISSLPDWTPGKQKGEIVNVAYTMPVAFALQ